MYLFLGVKYQNLSCPDSWNIKGKTYQKSCPIYGWHRKQTRSIFVFRKDFIFQFVILVLAWTYVCEFCIKSSVSLLTDKDNPCTIEYLHLTILYFHYAHKENQLYTNVYLAGIQNWHLCDFCMYLKTDNK